METLKIFVLENTVLRVCVNHSVRLIILIGKKSAQIFVNSEFSV